MTTEFKPGDIVRPKDLGYGTAGKEERFVVTQVVGLNLALVAFAPANPLIPIPAILTKLAIESLDSIGVTTRPEGTPYIVPEMHPSWTYEVDRA